MGKASRKKRQKEFQAESALKDKSLKSSETSSKWGLLNKRIVHLLLIAIIGLLVYSNTFDVPFHFDDANNIVENYKLKDLSNFWPPSGSRWFGFLTFALNYHSGGLNTTGYHIFNLTIHILNAILVYWLVVFTFRTPYFKVHSSSFIVHSKRLISHEQSTMSYEPSILIALFSALIFVSHPIQTQAVTYIVQRFASLATFFYLLSLVMYIKFRIHDTRYRIQDTPLNPPLVGGELKGGGASCIVHHASELKLHAKRYTLYAVSLISAILAMKTKEISFTLPFIITLYEFSFFKSQNHDPESSSGRAMNLRRLLYLMPFLLTLLVIPLSMIGINKPIGDAIGELREAAQETEEISRWGYLFTQFRVIVTYIRLLFLPINQNLDYDYPIYDSFFEPWVFLSLFFLLLIFAFGIYLLYAKRYTLYASRFLAFGILWFFITLSVESSIIPIVDVIFEHRVYLPSVGAVIAFSIAIFYVLQFTVHRLQISTSYFSLLTSYFLLLSTIVIVFSIATYQRNIVWKDVMSLWEDVVRKSPEKARGYNEVGVAYSNKGWFDKAIEHYQIALRLKPDLPEVHNNLGIAYSNKEWFDKAIEHYQTALRLRPDYPEVYINIGNVYKKIGLIEEAMQKYQAALLLKPSSSIAAVAHYNLGIIYLKIGLINEAKNKFQMALKLKPDFVEARQNLEFLMK